MADISDVERALVRVCAGALFPAGGYSSGAYAASAVSAAPPAGGAAAPVTTRLYRGWPQQAALLADVSAGKAHVSIYAEAGMSRDVSRWHPETVQIATLPATITATVAGATVTLAGTPSAGHVVGVQSGSPIAAYAYKAVSGDTLATIAAALAGKVDGASSAGAVLTMPTLLNLNAGVMLPQPVMTITRQQTQGFRIVVWAATPKARDALASLIDGAFAGLRDGLGNFTRFLPVGSYETARIQYRSTYVADQPSRDRVWRRDLCYTVEYPTTLLEQQPSMLFLGGPLWDGVSQSVVMRQWGAAEPSSEIFEDADGNLFMDADGNFIGAQPT